MSSDLGSFFFIFIFFIFFYFLKICINNIIFILFLFFCIFAVLILLGIGAIVSGGPILTGGMVMASVGWAGAALSISLSKSATLPRTASQATDRPPWEALMEALQLSENAKRVLFRDRELDLLRRTIQDDMASGDVHAALMLCDQMG